MQNTSEYNDAVPAEVAAKTSWKSPRVTRIDIKRTLAGASGTVDGYSPSHPA